MTEIDAIVNTNFSEPKDLETKPLERAIAGALFDIPLDSVTVAGVQIPIKFLFWEDEIKILDILAPYQALMLEAAMSGGLDEFLGALLVEGRRDLERLACFILHTHWGLLPLDPVDRSVTTPTGIADVPPEKVEEDELQAIRAWLRKNSRFQEITDLVLAQVKVNKLGESLGKLWAPGAQHVKALRILEALQSQNG